LIGRSLSRTARRLILPCFSVMLEFRVADAGNLTQLPERFRSRRRDAVDRGVLQHDIGRHAALAHRLGARPLGLDCRFHPVLRVGEQDRALPRFAAIAAIGHVKRPLVGQRSLDARPWAREDAHLFAGMHQSCALSKALVTFFAPQFLAGCIANTPEFNLRQAQRSDHTSGANSEASVLIVGALLLDQLPASGHFEILVIDHLTIGLRKVQ
jgi:hypothetical protein